MIGLGESLGQHVHFDGSDDDDSGGDVTTELLERADTPAPAGRGRGRGRGRGKAAAKAPGLGKRGAQGQSDTRKTSQGRVAKCSRFCGEVRELVSKQSCCVACFTDLQTMRRDAKAAGKQASAYLKSCEAKGKEEEMSHLYAQWRAAVGPCGSQVRVSLFDWGTYMVSFITEEGTLQQRQKLMKTQKEFTTIFEGKGMTPDWCKTEFKRRWALPQQYACDLDPDCGLPRVSMVGDLAGTDYLQRAKQNALKHGAKTQKTQHRNRSGSCYRTCRNQYPNRSSKVHSEFMHRPSQDSNQS